MEREFERAVGLLSRYEDGVRDLMPADAEIFDAHVHLGHDIDGQIGVYEELERRGARLEAGLGALGRVRPVGAMLTPLPGAPRIPHLADPPRGEDRGAEREPRLHFRRWAAPG